MQFTEAQIDSFIALYQQEFGIKLEREEAEKQANDLVGLIDRLYKPMTKAEHEKYYGLTK